MTIEPRSTASSIPSSAPSETAPADAAPDHTRSGRSVPTTDLALIASFAALICVCAYIGAIPVGAPESRSRCRPSR
ncbi:hypothetical protein [Nocardioides sambongensis]|uniref:hypothetical protein n=1 Tax=Nocardioides sambongensis TaxID=2589074 RepID=UPI001E363779|nr:hypothetical protein [Nocardioides sambongensis]